MITEIYKDFYGCSASIKHTGNDSKFTLTVRTSFGTLVHKGQYKTYRGAKIAMGKLSDGWKLISASGTAHIKL